MQTRRKYRALYPILGVLLTAACGDSGSPTELTAEGCEATPGQILVDRINQLREVAGIEALVVDVRLAQAAQGHTDDMAEHDFFERTGSDGSSVEDRVRARGFEPLFITENLGVGQETPEEIFDAWRGSPIHEAALLAEPATHLGVGHSINTNTQFQTFWTLTVASVDGPPLEPSDGCHS